MFEELISKKEILEVMEISYGQLYRWKRKKLIPEDWFIKKSVSTGQETFFPREKIMERIKIILELKDDVSLDDLASKFSNNIKSVRITRDYIIKYNVVSVPIIERFETLIKIDNIYDEYKLFALFIYDKLMQSGFLNLEEVKEITLGALRDYSEFNNKDYTLIIKRKLGVCFHFVILGDKELLKDESSVEVTRIKITEIINKINDLK